jgi:putative hemolysin
MVIVASAPSLARAQRGRNHIVDILIAERAPKLAATPLWPVLRPLLYAFLDYGKARRMADAIAPMDGRAAMAFVSQLLHIKVQALGLDRIPRQGPLVVLSNHPTGIADGVAVFDALKAVRPDIVFYANADAHRVAPGLVDTLIPVEWVDEKRTRERTRLTLTMTREALEAGRPLVIFPAGRIARTQPSGGAADIDWAPTAFSIARKYEAPILPLHLSGPWSTMFHFFHGFSSELRDITLFHELLNKRGKAFRLTVGAPIAPSALPHDAAEAAMAVKRYVEETLPLNPERPFA